MTDTRTTTGEHLNRARGHVFRVSPDAKSFELLKETVVDPRTNEGRSRHTVYWADNTRFLKVVRQNSFAGLQGSLLAHFQDLDDDSAAGPAAGREFVVLRATILAEDEDGTGWSSDAHNPVLPFKPDPTSPQCRGGTVIIAGKPVPVRLRGPRARVDIRTVSTADEFTRGFWAATVQGNRQGGRFVAETVEIYPRIDPREVDDPALPRILVVGDSISMNYHAAAKKALEGVANYHRIEGNGGPSDRGVTCMELWLGDYTQPGLHWDVIQFNHGLHDLKQVYDPEHDAYGAYQVPLEEYQANLEKEIQVMKKTGATLVWCSTTPVPNDSHGKWDTGTFGRRRDAVAIYNQAALEVIRQHPEIRINDLHRFISEEKAFDRWREQKDVHFWDGDLQTIIGQAVAERLTEVLRSRSAGNLPLAPDGGDAL